MRPRDVVIDVGTGAGRLALALAAGARRVIGIDRDAGAIGEARRRAAEAGLSGVEFVVADADAVEYAGYRPDLVVAHLYYSEAMVERAARALRPGGELAFVAFHVDQWRETGRVSRFARDETQARAALEAAGFVIEQLEIERAVRRFASGEAALADVGDLARRWQADRREAWDRFVAAGGRTLTQSHLLVRARRH